jgi:hypothetical protein
MRAHGMPTFLAVLAGLLASAVFPVWGQSGVPASSGQNPAGQTPAAPATAPRPEDLEPGVDTSRPATSSPQQASSTSTPAGNPRDARRPPSKSAASGSAADAGAISQSQRESSSAPTAVTPTASTPNTAAAPSATRSPAARPSTATGKAQDRLELDTTQITGNRELPKVLYIVPWKRSDLGDLVGKPVNSLVDEVLAPVDRDVFTRQNRYYDALKPDATKPGPGGAPPGPGAKPLRAARMHAGVTAGFRA